MLKELSLASLEETRLGGQFEEAMEMVRESLKKDADVKGAREITIKLSLNPDDRGFLSTEMSVTTSVPKRKYKSISTYEAGKIMIDTVTADSRQPSLLEDNGGKVTPIRKEGGVA